MPDERFKPIGGMFHGVRGSASERRDDDPGMLVVTGLDGRIDGTLLPEGIEELARVAPGIVDSNDRVSASIREIWREIASLRIMLADEAMARDDAVRETESHVSDVRSLVSGLDSRVGSVESGYGEVSDRLSSVDGRMDGLEDSVGASIDDIWSVASSAEGAVDGISSALSNAVSRLYSAETALSALSGDVSAAVSKPNGSIARLTARVLALEEAVGSVLSQLEGKLDKDASNDIVAAFEEIDSAVGFMNESLGEFRSRMDSNDATVASLIEDVESVSTAVSGIGEDVESVSESVSGLSSDVLSLREYVDSNDMALSDEIDGFRQYFDERFAAFDDLSNDVSSAISDIGSNRDAIESVSSLAYELSGRVSEAEYDISLLSSNDEEVFVRLSAIESRLDSNDVRIAELESNDEEVFGRLSSLESNDEEVFGRLSAVESRLDSNDVRITALEQVRNRFVDQLPVPGPDTEGYVYFTPSEYGLDSNDYDVYLTLRVGSEYVWVKV